MSNELQPDTGALRGRDRLAHLIPNMVTLGLLSFLFWIIIKIQIESKKYVNKELMTFIDFLKNIQKRADDLFSQNSFISPSIDITEKDILDNSAIIYYCEFELDYVMPKHQAPRCSNFKSWTGMNPPSAFTKKIIVLSKRIGGM